VPQVSLLRPGIPQADSSWKHPPCSLSLGAKPRECLNCQATGAARLEVEAEDSVPLCPPGRVPHVCVGVAGALHGLNKMGRSPFLCCLFRAAKSKNEKTLQQLGSKAPDKAVILSEALRSSIANRSRRACAERRELQFCGPFLEMFSTEWTRISCSRADVDLPAIEC